MTREGGVLKLVGWMRDGHRWLTVSSVLLIVGIAWTWRSAVPVSAVTGGQVPSPREGFLAPDFSLDLLGGGGVSLSDLRGQVVVAASLTGLHLLARRPPRQA